ncbi:MAG: IS110 family transposase [Bacteroidetes bacterium]|jgi:transposase|nr:IS110 family transposase [Bacteroidota bacterium]
MKIREIIGIDISKLDFHAFIHTTQVFTRFENSTKGFKALLKWVAKNSPHKQSQTLFVLEHTGRYSHNISYHFSANEIEFALVPGLEIKRSLGITRGKDDKIDAAKIALYGYRLRDEIKPTKLPGKQLDKLKRLLTLRDRMVRQRAGYKASLKEDEHVFCEEEAREIIEHQEDIIKALSSKISRIEKQMEDIIKANKKLNKLFKLLTSIKGVGKVTARYVIVYTAGFTKFATWRKFASYCGVAPFPHRSGTSVKGRNKVSNLANKKIKSLLTMCVISAIQSNPEMKAYYERRLKEGKPKMSTQNIIRNKLLARMFAVVKRGTPYVNTMKYAA